MASLMPTGGWGEIKPTDPPKRPIPGVRRGTTRRRARAIGMHMSDLWRMDEQDRQIAYQISKVGRR